jgi:hypothetical protein
VRAPGPPGVPGLACHSPRSLDPAAEYDVGLDDVDASTENECTRLRGRAHHLARGDAETVAAQRRVPVEIVRRKRLLEPVDAQALELVHELLGGAPIPTWREISRHAPALVRVHHDLEVTPDGFAHCFDHGEIDTPVARVEPELHRLDAGVS